jgi:hypothetical protein
MNSYEDYFSISEPFNPSKKHTLTYNEINYFINHKKNVLIKNMVFEPFNNNFMFDYVICLSRKNLFEATLSRVIALKTNIWDECHSANLKITIDFLDFKKFLDETIEWNKTILNTKCDKFIFYEDLTFDSAVDIKLFDGRVKHTHNYQTSLLYNKKQIITNYLELREKSRKYLNE